jgi:hypothetical protein
VLFRSAFELVAATSAARTRLREARISDWRVAREQNRLSVEEAAKFAAMEDAMRKVIVVDDFSPEQLLPGKSQQNS